MNTDFIKKINWYLSIRHIYITTIRKELKRMALYNEIYIKTTLFLLGNNNHLLLPNYFINRIKLSYNSKLVHQIQ